MRHWLLVPLFVLLLVPTTSAAAKKALFDNTKAETAGNADWQIDTDQPIPLPAQSGIGPATPRTYWLGAISSWGVDLVKRGYTVATLTTAYGITYQNAGNPYDLSNYDVFIVPEPNSLFTSAEATAILNYVRDGGGLVAVSDHGQSDRNGDGQDSPMIWNAMDPAHLLGVSCAVYNEANNNITQTSTNVNASASDSITRGPEGTVTGFAFHNGTTFTLYPSVNPSVRGEVWMTGLSQTSTTGLMAASSVYGNGRFVIAGDSSPADDGSATAGNSSIYDGWGEAGATDSTFFMNATIWATRRSTAGDVTAPAVSVSSPDGGESWKAGSSHAITWTATDAVGVTSVDLAWSSDGGATFPNALASGIANSGSWSWTVPNVPTGTARVRVLARDAAGNLGRDSSAANFTIDRWTLTASAGAGGSITPVGTVSVVQGASQGFSIAPATGYHIEDVLVDAGSVGAVASYDFSGVSANHTIAASFALNTYTIDASAGANGSITPGGAVTVSHGASQGFAIRPATGYHVLALTVDGGAVPADTIYTFSDVTAGHSIGATFSADQYALAVSAVGGGTVSKSPDQASYAYGASVQLDAVPVDGWAFASWSGDTSGSADPVTLTISGSRAVTATFVDVAQPTVLLTSPVGGETWDIQSLHEVSWTASDNVGIDAVDVDYSATGPAGPWLTVSHALANTGSVLWTLPAGPCDSVLVRVTAYDSTGNAGDDVSPGLLRIVDPTAGVGAETPAVLALARPQPNPSRGSALLRFSLPAVGSARLEIMDLSGRCLWRAEAELPPGPHAWRWDGRGADGGDSGAGLYFVRLVTPWGTRTQRLVRLK